MIQRLIVQSKAISALLACSFLAGCMHGKMTARCSFQFTIKELDNHFLYMEIVNHGLSDFEMPYDNLPWVDGVRSIVMDVYVNGKMVNPAKPMGENSKPITI